LTLVGRKEISEMAAQRTTEKRKIHKPKVFVVNWRKRGRFHQNLKLIDLRYTTTGKSWIQSMRTRKGSEQRAAEKMGMPGEVWD